MLSNAPLFALGFSQLAMLGWLAAAALPLLIHLWNRRRYREVTWAAMEYLLAAIQKNSRRLRIEQWLLLAVRTAIILLVVLAVAGPYLERAAAPFVAGRPTHRVFVIDGSYSMAYRPADKSRFDAARQAVTEILDRSRQGDAFTLVLMASPPRVIVGSPAFSVPDFLLEVQSLKLQHTGADLAATLARVQEMVRSTAAESTRLEQHEVYFLTDLGRTTWEAAVSESGHARTQLGQLANDAALWLVDLGQAATENFAVAELRTSQPLLTTAMEIPIEATIRSYANRVAQKTVELRVDGERMSEQSLEIPAGGEASVTFKHRFDSSGDHAIEVRLIDDLLDVDNHRWLSLLVKPAIETLIVNGEGDSRAANYLRFALNPDFGKADIHGTPAGAANVAVVPESGLLEVDLHQYDCVFLSNVGQFTAGEAQVLTGYLRSGGGLVFFLGDRVLADRYNGELGGQGNTPRVLPVVLDQPVATGSFSFDPLDYRHRFVAEFRGNEKAGLLQTPISKYFRMTPATADQASPQVALAFHPTNDPAIVAEQIERGRVVVVALPASLESVDAADRTPWTLMTATQSFQPIVQEILAWTVGGRHEGRNATVGDTIGGTAPVTAVNESIALRTPDGRTEQVRVTSQSDQSRWSFAETWTSGLYQAELASTGSDRQIFAVNLDTAESDLTKVAIEELPRALAPLAEWQDLDADTIGAAPRGAGVHRPLLYAALVLVFLESSLAWYQGHRTA